MGYTSWERFTGVIDRARNTAENLEMNVTSAFHTNVKRVPAGDGWTDRTDVNLSRFAAYLVAMNGDPRKPQVAAAQAYFTQATLMQEGHIPSATPEPVQEDPQPTASGPIVGVPVELATSLVTAQGPGGFRHC